jgi:hypothetical protein
MEYFISSVDTRFNNYLEQLSTNYKIGLDELEKLLQSSIDDIMNNNLNGTSNKILKKDTKKSEKTDNTETTNASETKCVAKMKSGARKGQECGQKICKNSDKFCSRHINAQVEEKEEIKGPIFRLNKFNNFSFGDTGLIMKSKTERYIIGKQLADGTVLDLTEDDIKVCKQYKFKYCPKYSEKVVKNDKIDEKVG